MSATPLESDLVTTPARSEALLEGAHTSLVLRTKAQIAWNSMRHIKRHVYLHAGVGILMMLLLVGGGTGIFLYVFNFLMRQPVFGAPLMDRLVGMVLLIFFSMLLFSNLIITLSTTYLSREVEFLMALPISRQSIFRQKLVETIIYSSWAFALLSLPLFASYGISRDAPWFFYLLIIPLVLPFLAIPAAIGAIFTMVLTSFLPARKTRSLCIALGVLSIGAAVAISKFSGLGRMLANADQQDLLQIMNGLALGNSPLLPSAWLSAALMSIAPSSSGDINMTAFAYWLAMLVATALFLLQVCRWLVPSLYYRGWCLSRDAAVREVESNATFSPFRYIDAILQRSFRPSSAGLLSKDLKTFWRDPSQWTQLVILFGLMIVYVMNIGWSMQYSRTMELVVKDWKTMLGFFNLAATCFILSILTTRFVFPMLSLEGRGFWTVGLAPIPRSRIVWQKYGLCLVLCLVVSLPLTYLSNLILDTTPGFLGLSLATALLMSAGLTSLSVGLGAILPDFKEDNPARIANGIGGTFNVLISLAYIGVTVTLLAIPVALTSGEGGWAAAPRILRDWFPAYVGVFLLVEAAVIALPMRIGLRRWDRMEF